MNEHSESENAFDAGMSGTSGRDRSQASIENLRQVGGVFVEAVRATRMAMVLTDPNLPDNPIVFANQSFLDLSGYAMNEVLGQQPHFMNGPDTDPQDAARFSRILEADEDGAVETVQYAKDGRRFVATVLLSAFKDECGKTLHQFLSWADVTRRVKAEDDLAALRDTQAALRESEERLQRVIDTAAVGVLFFDAEGYLVDANEAFLAMTGYSRKEVTSGTLHWLDMTPPEWLAVSAVQMEQFRDSGRVGPYEKEYFCADGSRRWMLFAGRDLGDGSIAEFAVDITARRQAEEALRESEARLAAAFESVPLGVAVIDPAGHVVIANSEFRRFLPTGIIPSRDPATVHRWRAWGTDGRLIAPSDFPSARALRGERVVPGLEMLYTDETGREIWTNVATAPIRNSAGRITGAVSVIHDIDARKRSAEALRDSEERFREFGENSSDVLWIADLEGKKLEYLSPAYERIWGESRQRMLTDYSHWAETIHPDDLAEASQAMPRLMSGEAAVAEYRIVRPDGAIRWIRDTGFPIRRDGKIVRGGGIAQDVTELRRADQRQTLLLAELQHRVRNIMAMVRSVVRQSSEGYSTVEDFVAHLVGRLDAMARTQGLLTRAAGAQVNLEDLVRDELHAQVADEARLTIHGKEVGLSAKAAEVLTLALHELATNSIKYGALSDPRGRLAIAWEETHEDGQAWLDFTWQEWSPSLEAEPITAGFGTELIEERVPYELRGRASLQVLAGGMRAAIAFPLTDGSSILETGDVRGGMA